MSDDGDKTESPTLRRRSEARRRGQIPRSADLSAAVVLGAALATMQLTGPRLVSALKGLFAAALSFHGITLHDIAHVAAALLPLLIALVAAALIVNLAQVGFFFRFKLGGDALNPAMGFERLFSRKSLARLAIDLVKLSLIAWLLYCILRDSAGRIVALQEQSATAAWSVGASMLISAAWRIVLLLLALGVVDYFYQRWQHERDLRMTPREIKDELRQMERAGARPRAQKGGA